MVTEMQIEEIFHNIAFQKKGPPAGQTVRAYALMFENASDENKKLLYASGVNLIKAYNLDKYFL